MSLPDQPDPFSASAIKEPEPLLSPHDGIWDGFRFNKSLESRLFWLNEGESESLPGLRSEVFQLDLHDIPLPELSDPASISTSDSENAYFQSLDGDIPGDEGEDEEGTTDIWALPEIQNRRRHNPLVSWDDFLDTRHQEPPSGYLSEAATGVLNVILKANNESSPRPIKPDVLLNAAYELCLGRDSVLFSWDEKNRAFAPQWQNVAAHAYSPMLVQSCFEEFAVVGMAIKNLSHSLRELDQSYSQLSSSRVAILSASRSILHAVHRNLCDARPDIMSLLQLRGRIAKIQTLLDVLGQCHDALDQQHRQSLAVWSLLQKATTASLDYPSLNGILQLTVSCTCRPFLAVLSAQIGLSTDQPTDARLSEGEPWKLLLESSVRSMIQEAQESLSFLRKHAPACCLLSTTAFRSSPLKALELGFHFQAICQLQSRAVAYEDAMRSLIVSEESSASTSTLDTPISESFGLGDSAVVQKVSANPFRLESNIFNSSAHLLEEIKDDGFQDQVVSYLEGQAVGGSRLPIGFEESLNLSTTPLISAQHRLLSYSVLRLLFQEQNFLGHLDLQRSFHLLQNASFSSRLSTALFDSNQNSGESQRRTSASTGLRLQARDSWPPAGSEVRLVLMSILSDSLSLANGPLDKTISFSIRDMPLEELEKCRDVDSIHALDFLRLQYTAPNEILEAVIAPSILAKYDRIFQYLLRTMRMQALTQSMLKDEIEQTSDKTTGRSCDKIIVEMHHFISTVADYSHNIAIEVYWRKFEAVLRDAKTHIVNQDYEQTLRAVQSLNHLRALHERTLDLILHALLKQRQARTRQILEEVYDVILRFSAERRKKFAPIAQINSSIDGTMKRLRNDFRTKVLQFMDALRSGKQALDVTGKGEFEQLDDSSDDVDMFECLLLRLDMSGYWTRQRGRVITTQTDLS
ncbi:hypothetical protein A1O7_00295 [Cladophialophora yegresii CBS 114405]|uniref:Spindle pole body component n=1 Tax=Cladophialophora yegresii CBS 114405 TaxID=1182544 RepID=W9WG40_9EURO|nr:uncharacterized protein A1O7_00295 [Cladophialophora yegresii CBS 114405]EXJ63960.1 hypothetical protein A1O7_00295 [Cladophialophora yegresii CBS 114405]